MPRLAVRSGVNRVKGKIRPPSVKGPRPSLRDRTGHPPTRGLDAELLGGWPTQAWFWLEWGSSTAGQSLPAARSRFRAIHSDSISTRLQRRLRSGENCSTPSPPDVRTTQPSPASTPASQKRARLGPRIAMNVTQLLHKLRIILNIEILVPLLPEMLRIANQTPRYSLLQRLQRIGQRILLWFAEQEVNMLGHHYIAVNVESVTPPHPFQG